MKTVSMKTVFYASGLVTMAFLALSASILIAAPPPVALIVSFPAFWAGVSCAKAARRMASRDGRNVSRPRQGVKNSV